MEKISHLILFMFSAFFFAQSDIDTDQHELYTLIYSKDLQKAKKVIDTKFLKSDNKSKKIIGYVFLADYYSFFDDKENEKVEALENGKKIATETKNPIDMAYVQYGYTRYYKNLSKNELFIKNINESIKTFEGYSNENFILTQLYFLRFKYKSENPLEKDTRSDCIRANLYALKSKNSLLINFTYSNLGYFYKIKFNETGEKKYLDSANHSYKKSYDYISLIKEKEARKKSLLTYYLNYSSLINALSPNTYNQSLNQYYKILEISERDDKYVQITSLTYNNIGSAYENLKKIDSAENYYLKAYNLSKNDEDIPVSTKLIIFNNLSRVYERAYQPEKALSIEREAKDMIRVNSEKQFANNTKSLEIFYKTQQKTQQIHDLEKQRHLYIIIIILSLIGITFLIYIFYNKQRLHKQKTALLETEQKFLALQQQKLQKQALATSLQLDSKNNFIKELKENIGDKKDLSLERILKEEQLSDNDFSSIQKILQEIHPNFFKSLQDLATVKLTNLDMKYSAYIYLNLDNQQISNVLKVDPNTVRTTKYRLKQKYGLTKNDDLNVFIQNVKLQ